MNAHYLLNLTKAARAGMAHYASPDDWNKAIEALAKANRNAGEPVESAYARLTKENPTCRQFDKMRREALAQADIQKAKGGRPRKYHPGDIQLRKAEDELGARAMRRAKSAGISFERAFVQEIDTPEGQALYRQTRRVL